MDSDLLEISRHMIVMEIHSQPTFPFLATLAPLTLWLAVAGYGALNITMARVAIINYANVAAPSQSNCEVMKQVPGPGQPGIHEYGEYRLTYWEAKH